MAQHRRILGITAACVLSMLFPSLSRAGTWVAFQNNYTRGTGSPVTVTSTLTLLNPATQYTLKAFNGGLQNDTTELVSNSVVFFNGVQVLGPANFNQSVAEVNVSISPGLTNTLSVQVRGKPGGVLTIQVIGGDNDPPTITASVSPAPNAAGWNNSPVTVSFTCSDKTSGVATCPSPVNVGAEGANQVVSGTATDLAGNTATMSVTINLDMTPPTVTGTINPPPDAGGYNSGPVTVTFACTDALSGVASCSPAVSVTNEGSASETGTAVDVAGNTASATVTVKISFNYFKIQSWQTGPNGNTASPSGKCLDYGSSPSGNGATVFLNDCSAAHPIRVVELAPNCNSPRIGSHGTPLCYEVMLFGGNSVIGVHNPGNPIIGTAPPPPPTELQLELQAPYNSQAGTGIFTATQQVFRLDGDSIILEGSHLELQTNTVLPIFVEVPGPCISTGASVCPPPLPQLVIQVQNARGGNGSPLVAAIRNLSDNEFWDFNAADGSDKDPTSGFVRVATREELLLRYFQIIQIAQQNNGAAWGSVIKIIDSPLGPINLTPNPDTLVIPTGLTVRGDRRGTNLGPLLLGLYQPASSDFPAPRILDVEGDFVRITGLRLQGPTRATDATINPTDAIEINASFSPNSFAGTLIDHNDLSDWNNAAVEVFGVPVETKGGPDTVTCPVPDSSRNDHIRIERNFIHHNEEPLGYGISFSIGGAATISKNTFLLNRHSIAGDGDVREQYSALFNLSLSHQPRYGIFQTEVNQTFDMHGAFGGYGGYAGGPLEIAWNTFLPSDGDVFWLRGQPCNLVNGVTNAFADSFHNNVSLRNHDEAIRVYDVGGNHDYPTSSTSSLTIENNQFADSSPSYSDPTEHLGVGDFDGDGDDDLFLTTGASWYYSPAGSRDWRFLSAKVDRIDTLLLGDFDGDGRTDVVGMNPSGQFDVSWGGVSDWEVINQSPCANGVPNPCPTSVQNMVAGDFDGDGKPDILYTDKVHWYISYGGTMPFAQVNDSSFLVQDLRFGHFALCGSGAETDVFSVQNTGWYVSCGATTPWQLLGAALTKTVLVVADFNGDGIADVLAPSSDGWQISFGGSQPWTDVPQLFGSFTFVAVAGVGHFTGQPQTDVLVWNGLGSGPIVTGTELLLSAAAVSPATQYSTQDMR